MDDIKQNLISYTREVNNAKAILSQLTGVELDSMEVQFALRETQYRKLQPVELLDKKLYSDQIVDILKDYNFSKPEKIDEVVLDESILHRGCSQVTY